jgi:hypothetical protein
VRLSKRIESNTGGQVVLTLLMAVLVLCTVGWNLPAGRPHDRARHVAGPVVQALGLEQDWALFAPDPRSFGVSVYATLTYEDGHTRRWDPPHNGLLVTPYRNYRWQKYVERLRADDYMGLWEPTSAWLARELGPGVVTVVLTRTFRNATVPGDGLQRPRAGTFDFYTWTRQ